MSLEEHTHLSAMAEEKSALLYHNDYAFCRLSCTQPSIEHNECGTCQIKRQQQKKTRAHTKQRPNGWVNGRKNAHCWFGMRMGLCLCLCICVFAAIVSVIVFHIQIMYTKFHLDTISQYSTYSYATPWNRDERNTSTGLLWQQHLHNGNIAHIEMNINRF